jgi:aryl-alcohol dehydrogenase-like predicted oxidoreductase
MTESIKTTGNRVFTRREFVKLTAAATGIVASTGLISCAAESRGEIPRRALGRTGEKVSIVGLGGYHIGLPRDEEDGIRIIRGAIDRGINFMDNCWDYHDGRSEVRMGKALRDGYREKVFLMTKIDGRTKAVAAKQIDECLRRLQTDRIDLMQFHEIVRMGDIDRIFAEGAIEAVQDARKAGKIRFVGFTGHKGPEIHLHALEVGAKHEFRFDAVQMPLNVMDAHFRSFEKKVLPVLLKDEVGVLGMKALGFGAIPRGGTASATECLQYVMNLPVSTVITGLESMRTLDQAIEAAVTFKPMAKEQVSALLARTSKAAESGDLEQFKTTTQFDATTRNPDWTG